MTNMGTWFGVGTEPPLTTDLYPVQHTGPVVDFGGAVYNVKHPTFGAAGDGTTDDTAAIQAALDYVGSLPTGGTVFLPAGLYLLTSSLYWRHSNVTLLGAGFGAWNGTQTSSALAANTLYYTLGQGISKLWQTTPGANWITFDRTQFPDQNGRLHGIQIDSITFGGINNTGTGIYDEPADSATADDTIRIFRCYFYGMNNAIDISSDSPYIMDTFIECVAGFGVKFGTACINPTVRSCIVTDCGADGILISAGVARANIFGNLMGRNATGIMDLGNDSIIEHNQITQMRIYGIAQGNSGGDTFAPTGQSNRSHVLNNKITSAASGGLNGIFLHGNQGVVSGNSIYANNSFSIGTFGDVDSLISNNFVYQTTDTGNDGIAVQSAAAIVTGNYVKTGVTTAASVGISIRGTASNVLVSGNNVVGTWGGGAMTVAAAVGHVARNNVPYNPVGVVTPAVPASTVAVAAQPYDRMFYVTDGALGCTMAIQNGPSVVIPATSFASVFVPANKTVTPTYTNAPTWVVEGQ
jgi:hypothetical protein